MNTEVNKPEPRPTGESKPKIHRVCITCNYMFPVDGNHPDQKQCPKCRKE